ncbi:AAA family ATPase [Burkholderia sp. LMG 21824]|uniref:AAA family ATPase n=1 Tax=Burkholderia sp. LMG 21824 TaxID=3158172 RepID=UPI003C2DA289
MHIETVWIRNFRRIKDVRTDLAPDNSILDGSNNSAKSSAGHAIRLFTAASKDRFSLHDFSSDCWDDINAFVDMTPHPLSVQNSEAISAAIFDSERIIEKPIKDGEARSYPARGLMGRFHDFGMETIKGSADAMANRLVGNVALKRLSIESLTASDFAILSGAFGPSKELDRIGDGIHKDS